jgi:hypothetical protein
MEALDNWLQTLSTWLIKLVKSIFTTIADLIGDLLVKVLDWILIPVGDLIAAIPAPSFLEQGGGLGGLLSGLPAFAQFIVGQCQIGPALAVIGAGVSFRLLRKLFTLGQW